MNKLGLGERIRVLRKSKKLRQEDLAANSGVSLPVIKSIESGKGNPTLDSLSLISSVLGASLEEIFRGLNPSVSAPPIQTKNTSNKSDSILNIQARLTSLDESQLGRVDKFITDLLKSAPATSSSSDSDVG